MSVQSLHRLQCLIDLVHDYVLVVSVHGTVAYVSPTLISVLNVAPASVANSCILSFLHPNDAALLQASLLNIHQQRSSLTSPTSTHLSFHHTLRFIHADQYNHNTATAVSCHVRPFDLDAQPAPRISSVDSITTPFIDDFDSLFHPLMTGFRGSGRISFPSLAAPSVSTTPTSSSPTSSLRNQPPVTNDHNTSGASQRSDLYLLVGRRVPLGPHDAILDQVVPMMLLNQRLRASLLNRYRSIDPLLVKSPDTASQDNSLAIPSTSVLRESSFDPILMAVSQSQNNPPIVHSPDTATGSFLLTDSNLTHVPPPLAISLGSSGMMIPPKSSTLTRSSKTSSSGTSATDLASSAKQYLPAIGHGSGLAGFMSPSDFVDANIMSIKGTRHGSSLSSVSSSSSGKRNNSRPDSSPTISNAAVDVQNSSSLFQHVRCPSFSQKKKHGRLSSSSAFHSHPRKRKLAELGLKSNVCMDCGTNSSPEWRRGPTGDKCLCNACGLRFAKRKKLEREASSSKLLREIPTTSPPSLTPAPILSSSSALGVPLSHDVGCGSIVLNDSQSRNSPIVFTNAGTSQSHSAANLLNIALTKGPLSILCGDASPTDVNSPTTDVNLDMSLNAFPPSTNANRADIVMPRYQQEPSLSSAKELEFYDISNSINPNPTPVDHVPVNLLAPSPESVASLPSLSELIGPPITPQLPVQSRLVSAWFDDSIRSESSYLVSTPELGQQMTECVDTGQLQFYGPQGASSDPELNLNKSILDPWWSNSFLLASAGTSSSSVPPQFRYDIAPTSSSPVTALQPIINSPLSSLPCAAGSVTQFGMDGTMLSFMHQLVPFVTLPVPVMHHQISESHTTGEIGGNHHSTVLSVAPSSNLSNVSHNLGSEFVLASSQLLGIQPGHCGAPALHGLVTQDSKQPSSSKPLLTFSTPCHDHVLAPAEEYTPNLSIPNPALPHHQPYTGFAFPFTGPSNPVQTMNSNQYLNNLNALNKEKQLDAKLRSSTSQRNQPKKAKRSKPRTSSSTKSTPN